MNTNDHWSVSLSIVEIDGQTHAEARVVIPGEDDLVGRGQTRRNPADREVALIGEQIAAARALSDLAGRLLHAAADNIGRTTHERPHLHV
jgi:Domain of unknown function (DUF1876)